MKTKKHLIVISLFFACLFFFSSCYTKKRGVVPCPTWGQTNHIQHQSINSIPVAD
ncbi:MAG: hypothetical protein J7K64_05080 [Bacteroidales bacterium]|nr:hypothetical protein [Bacteroidales bacterium]